VEQPEAAPATEKNMISTMITPLLILTCGSWLLTLYLCHLGSFIKTSFKRSVKIPLRLIYQNHDYGTVALTLTVSKVTVPNALPL
jgi:hypothetical protein